MKRLILIVLFGVVVFPIAAILTFLLSPFWSWLEATTGIESIGHSGPAEWCFLVSYIAVCLVSLAAWFLFRRKEPRDETREL